MKKILTEWRGFVNEISEEKQADKFPEKVYYGISMTQLDNIRDSGVVNLPQPQDIQNNKIGVPTCNSPSDAFEYGDVVLEVSGQYLNESGEYVCTPNSKGSRISMTDSSYSSGSGIDSMVDNLGTRIPFSAVHSLIFKRKPDVPKLRSSGFSNVGVSMVDPNNPDELQELYVPEEEN